MSNPNNIIAPKDGLAGLAQNWKNDILSGFFVFLIALPLCLGISIASGAPPMSGIFAAIVGGMVVSLMGGSYVTINGPAAGLIAVILNIVISLGNGDPAAGYRQMTAAVVIAGFFLFVAGFFKAGKLGDFFPTAAVHGMLSAIGIMIISKQIHIMLGVKAQASKIFGLLAEIPHSLMNMNPYIGFIGIISILIMIFLPMVKNKYVKMIPPPLVVVLVGIMIGQVLDLERTHKYLFFEAKFYEVGPKYLVNLPYNILEAISFPDFSGWQKPEFIKAVITITLIQGLETMLSAKAVNQLDPYKREANLNKDMSAIGAGSMVSGLIGGLPMIAEIVRSSANINNGAKTRWSNFFHGMFMLCFVALLPHLIHKIPLACLSAMLVFTGFRLASPKEFIHTYHIGKAQLLIYVSTIVATLATDLLVGIGVGIIVKILTHLYYGVPVDSIFKAWISAKHEDQDTYHIFVSKALIFFNFLPFKKYLERLPKDKKIILDFSEAVFIDHTCIEHLHNLQNLYIKNGGKFEITGMENLASLSDSPLSAKVATERHKIAKLAKRQEMLLQVAQQNDYTFSPQKILFDSKLKNLPFFFYRHLRYEENVLHKHFNKVHLQVSDIKAREGSQISLRFYHFTGLLITDIPKKLPIFYLEKESLVHRMLDSSGFRDINFEEHKQFSDNFFLQGTNELEIREFFTVELMNILMQNPDFHIESDGESLFIFHGEMELLEELETHKLVQLGETLVQYLTIKKKQVA
jgi:MFS superfamily sulfate permease-like transporter